MTQWRCDTCKWWGDMPERYGLMDVRRCTRIPQWHDATEWDENGDNVLKPEFAGVKAFAEDGSGYYAALATAADFGCAMWQRKDGP